ncbi:MAG: hypoxanthine phosphoribosyltransferase [Dysgonamonadaceae bacterium]|jgi:hypoxanthine phosphoribosyltransferase|nr:hypoxanthine phosphoribosyltransferase [Dysgonamonadaceae bacterium]
MTAIRLKDKTFNLFISEQAIIKGIERVAEAIVQDMTGKSPLFICVLNGAFMFASDLMKRMDIPCEIDFIRLSSYRGTRSSGAVKEIQGLVAKIENRHVVIVEDIIDTGHTISYLKNRLRVENPASITTACLLFKPEALQTGVKPDYCALEIPNDFIVGYGLDYEGLGRNLRHIYKIKN